MNEMCWVIFFVILVIYQQKKMLSNEKNYILKPVPTVVAVTFPREKQKSQKSKKLPTELSLANLSLPTNKTWPSTDIEKLIIDKIRKIFQELRTIL